MENKWMTREEFESKHTGFCWVAESGFYVDIAYYYEGKYYESPNQHSFIHDTSEIKAVMPIEKPEYPTCDAPIAHAGIAE